MDGSSLPDIRPVAEISLTALQSRFASRHPLRADDIGRLADRVTLLRVRYNEQLQRAKIQFVDPRLKLSSCRALLVMARAVVSVSQLVYQAVRSLDAARLNPTQTAVDPDVVETGLAWNDAQLARIAGHLHGLDTADAHSAWLKILLTQLESYPRISASDWTRLAQQVLAAGADRLDAELGLPLPSVALKAYFEEIGRAQYAEVMGRGIEAAQIVARMVLRRSPIGFDPELLTVAALCQDCGLLLGSSRSASKGQMRALHASIGAGLAASLVELATELPVLVAEHHRRLNEPLVAPNVLSRNRNRGSRMLGVIVRWLELIDDMSQRAAEATPLAGTVDFSEPARRLVRETIHGDWDRSIASDLMDTLGFRSESQALHEADRIARFGIREDARRRVDSADERWPQSNLELPNLELAPRNREIDHVRAAR
ncbi:MAG TPA: hypothetical protein VGP63_30045 [Planctomycetaceae bacterium]|nr:hypothetical protein [Planctomycetaceae bacterium]